jgi:hypothetical protein
VGAQELIVYGLSAVALALVAATVLTLRRGRPTFPPATPRALLERRRNADSPPAPPERPDARRPPPAAESATQGRDPAPERRAAPPASAAEDAVLCQLEWRGKGQGSCFTAVTIDARGVRHSLATSRRVEWRGSTPPDASPESRAAVRQLMKILHDNGWQPLPGNGEDHGQERWYARRFRRPAAT